METTVSTNRRTNIHHQPHDPPPVLRSPERPAPRRHRGPRLTERDLAVLRWVGEQYAVRFDQLQRLLGEHSTDPEHLRCPGVLSLARTRRVLQRWEMEDLVSYKLLLAGEQGWVWLTRKGLSALGLEVRYYEPRPAALGHLYYINQARLYVQARRQDDRWIAERLLRSQQEARGQAEAGEHLPDGVLLKPDQNRIAIEVELSAKSKARLFSILHDLVERYYRTWYFAPAPVVDLLQYVLHTAPFTPEQRRSVQILPLEGRL